jgi:predicted alpha/beta hydrolase
MHINLEPVMYVGRGYQLADGYEQRRPYDLVFSVFKVREGVARVFAAHGEIDRATFKRISKALAEKGFHTALVERHGIEQEWSTGLQIPVKSDKG